MTNTIISSLTAPTVSIKADYRLEDKFSLEIFRLAKLVKKYGRLEEEDKMYSDQIHFITGVQETPD